MLAGCRGHTSTEITNTATVPQVLARSKVILMIGMVQTVVTAFWPFLFTKCMFVLKA